MAKSETYLVGGTALTMDDKGTQLEDAVIHIQDGKIVSVTSKKGFTPPSGSEVVDTKNCLVMPGLVNGHTHSAMTLLRGYAEELPLLRWLKEVVFPAEQKHGNREFVHLGTLLACIEMVRSGTTTFNDMYYFEEETARASHKAGLRAVCGQTFIEIKNMDHKPQSIVDTMDKFRAEIKDFPLIYGAISPHAIYSVSQENFETLIGYARTHQMRIHLHLSEIQGENDDCVKLRGKTPTEYLESLGLWNEKVIAAHGTCLTEKDIAILGKAKAGVVHNPESNMKLGTRIAPIAQLRKAGAHVGLGTDSVASNNNLDLFQEIDFAAKLQVFANGPGALKAEDAVRMMTIEGARALHLGDEIGSLEVGKQADIIAVDIDKPHAVPMYNPYTHLVYSGVGTDVKHAFIAGRQILKNRVVTTLDEAAIVQEVREWGKKIAHR